jgi:hypothetical protein
MYVPFFFSPPSSLFPYLSLHAVEAPVSQSPPSSLLRSIVPLPPVEDADSSTGPSTYPSYPLPPIRNDMHPRRPPHSLRLVTTPLRLKGPSYKHSTSFEDIREFVHDSYGKKGDGGYEGSGS